MANSELPLIDLGKLAAELERSGRHPAAVKAVRRAHDVASAHQDISQAVDALTVLMRLTKGDRNSPVVDNEHLGTIASALLTAAIVFYSRSTDTKPIKRRKWFGTDFLPLELKRTHSMIMQLRNKEVAHFGSGLEIDQEVVTVEALVLRPFDPEHPIGFLSSRAQNKALFTRRFLQLAETVMLKAERAVSERSTELNRALIDAFRADQTMRETSLKFIVTDERLLAADRRADEGWVEGPDARRFATVVSKRVDDPDPETLD